MGALVWGQLFRRWQRTLALLIGVVVATTSFLILTTASDTSRLQVVDTVRSNFRSAYDIVVRPAGSASDMERRENLVRGNFVSGIYGGISEAQVAQVRDLPGIEIAAPVAVIGITEQLAQVPVDVQDQLGPADRQVIRVAVTRRYDQGSTTRRDSPQYLYATRTAATPFPRGQAVVVGQLFGPTETIGGRKTPICALNDGDPRATRPFTDDVRSGEACWSAVSGSIGSSRTLTLRGPRAVVPVPVPFTFVLVAVDPVAEAGLEGLDRSVTAGRYLTAQEGLSAATDGFRSVPVLVADRPFTTETTTVAVQQLAGAATAIATSGRTALQQVGGLAQQPGVTVDQRTLSTAGAYAQLVARLRDPGQAFQNLLSIYWTGSPTSFTQVGPQAVRPTLVSNPESTWAANFGPAGMTYLPKSADGNAYRRLTSHVGNNSAEGGIAAAVALHAVGVFDPTKLAGFSALGYPGLSTFQAPTAQPADTVTRQFLHDQALQPDGNPAGYLAQPPSLITTMAALPSLVASNNYNTDVTVKPVSVIRVRVAGVRGPDAVSRERIRRVAELIKSGTGLDVDITAGASATPVQVSLPADLAAHRPALLVDEPWARKGTALAVLHQVDRKSLLLFVLVLAACAMFAANSSTAALRSRRSELGVLSCFGWTRRHLVTLVVSELLAVGAVAGLLGAAAALPVAAVAGVHLNPLRVLLVVPAAAVLTALAGLSSALSSSRVAPLTVVRPAVHVPRRARSPRGVTGLAVSGITRVPGRSLVAGSTLAVAVGALTLLLSISLGFRGAITGSLLGDAVTVQVRGPDYAAALVMVVLGLLAVVDVLYLGVRERAAEYALLSAAGWTDGAMSRLVSVEGALIGAGGAAAGALIGGAIAVLTAGRLPAAVGLAAAATVVGGTGLAGLVGFLPARRLRHETPVRILAAE